MPDSSLIAAALLLGVSLFAAVNGVGVYLRFAAMLCAALALAVPANAVLPGLAGAVALLALPLAGASLGLCAAARLLRPLPPLAATLALVAALGAGLSGLAGAGLAPALLPVLLGGLLAAVAALHRAMLAPLLAGVLLMAAACAVLARGPALPGLVLLAAALAGFAIQRRVSNSGAVLARTAP